MTKLRCVPVEPTEEMLAAGRRAGSGPGWLSAYRAMLTAAPLPADIEAALKVAKHWNTVLKCHYEPQLEQHATDMLLVARALLKSHGKKAAAAKQGKVRK